MSGDVEIKLATWESNGLRLACGPYVLQVGRSTLRDVAAQLRVLDGKQHFQAMQAAEATLDNVTIEGPVVPPLPAKDGTPHAGDAWSLAPLATADGTLRGEIVDAHLMFDAKVTVPIRRGVVDFNAATVEHVGPDSRMGVSKMGIYVDAANGRSYLYQFAATPVAGVSFERRGPLPGPWASDRGSLQLQAFMEAMLQRGPAGAASAVTDQARLLLGRTAAGGELQLGDGKFAAPGVQGELTGRTAGRNRLRLHSEAVGRGISIAMDALSLRQVALAAGPMRLACDEITGSLTLRLSVQDGQLRFALANGALRLAGLRLDT